MAVIARGQVFDTAWTFDQRASYWFFTERAAFLLIWKLVGDLRVEDVVNDDFTWKLSSHPNKWVYSIGCWVESLASQLQAISLFCRYTTWTLSAHRVPVSFSIRLKHDSWRRFLCYLAMNYLVRIWRPYDIYLQLRDPDHWALLFWLERILLHRFQHSLLRNYCH